MILDKSVMFADDLPHNGTAEVLDLGGLQMGPGKGIKLFVQGSSNLAGTSGFRVRHGDASNSTSPHITVACDLPGNIIELELTNDIKRFVTIELTGSPSTGTWSAGVVLSPVQTAK